MKEGFSKRFAEWQNYMHYVFNALFLLGETYILMSVYNISLDFDIFSIILISFLIFLNDTLIHALFWFLPNPIRWRD